MTKTPSDPTTRGSSAGTGGAGTGGGPTGGGAPSPLTVAAGVRAHGGPAGANAAASATARTTVVEPVTGAQSLVRSLEALGVDVMFGIPGGAILPAYDPIFDSTVRHVLVRHEQGAGHAATGYAQATGQVGVCIATSGPGRDQPRHADRRRVHGLGADGRHHRPGAAAARSASDAFQEADIHGITLPITKHNYLVQTAEDMPASWPRRSTSPATGRPGPVLVDVPKDVLQARTTSPGRRRSSCPATGRRCSRTASRSARRPG